MKTNKKSIFSYLLLLLLLTPSLSGIIEPDDILPLEISPSYTKEQGKTGTYFIFRFYIPNHVDKDNMPTMRGYGATNDQYIGIQFTPDLPEYDKKDIIHSCKITQIENNLDINLIALNDEYENSRILYCKINSFNNNNLILPGYNYKLTLTFLQDVNNIDNLISITIFTSTLPDSSKHQIIDIGTFNHINIIKFHLPSNQYNSVATLEPVNTILNIPVESDFNFDIKIKFNEWFSFDNYIICINLPKNQVSIDNPKLEITKPSSDSLIETPIGDMVSINLETTDVRKYIGFFLDGSTISYNDGDILLFKFSGMKTKDAGLISETNNDNGFIGVEIRYRNSYVICSSTNMKFEVSMGNVVFTVKHPESSDDGNYVFDVFQGGAFQIEFNILLEKNLNDKYIVIKQNTNKFKRVTFIASTCDFSDFNIASTNFNEIPKCNPIKYKNYNYPEEDNNNGIFFYYPYIMKAKTNYKLRVWMFFDICEYDEDNPYDDTDKAKIEIKFSLEMYNDIHKDKIAENRLDTSYIFMKEIKTEKGIICYNTYMGEKQYNNGYLFNMESYSYDSNKILYREYFNWNIYDHSNNGNDIFNNLYDSDKITPKFIYSKNEDNILQGGNLLLVNKIALDSGNNEKLGQFFPMGLSKTSSGSYKPIKSNFFMKLSKNFFTSNSNSDSKCYVSWGFGSPSINEKLDWSPKQDSFPNQKYQFIVNSDKFFSDDTSALFEPAIETIEKNYLESKTNTILDDDTILWSFGDDETINDQISDDAPVYVYFGLADTCHSWTNLSQTITSLYTPIEIIIGVKGLTTDYLRVMRFIKLYPEAGVWHDNTIDEDSDMFIRSSNFIVKNHFAFNELQLDEEDNLNDRGVCLLEILPGILDSRRSLSSNFFLWIFLGSLLETEYPTTPTPYPVGNLKEEIKAYGYSSQHSLNINNFYAKPSDTQNSDITTPIYTLAQSMTSIYQSASSGYLFYLGSLIVFYNKVKSNSMYDISGEPLLIPYYCPYYISSGEEKPFDLGIFPAFIAGFGSFESMTNFGNKGFDRLVGKKINDKQINVLMLSEIKIYDKDKLKHFYNTVKFMNDYNNNNLMTLNVWNSDNTSPCDNEYDSIDSFLFFFNEKIAEINSVYPQRNIPSSLKSLSKSKKGTYCFYVYGKKFCSGIYGLTNTDLELTRNTPNTGDKNPYLSIILNFEISDNLLICESSPDIFCPNDIIGFWGLSANHGMPSYVTNFGADSFLLDYYIFTNYKDDNIPTFELGQALAYENDPAIYVKITFNSPFGSALSAYTILSFYIKNSHKEIIKDSKCSVQLFNVELPSVNCETDSETGEISCQLVTSSLKYNIFCYKLNYGSNGRFYFSDFKLNLPNNLNYKIDIFYDSNEYILNIDNSVIEQQGPTIQPNYITTIHNINAYSKLELTINLKRQAYPGMEIEIKFDEDNYFDNNTECIFSLDKLNTYSLNDIDMDDLWIKGNANIYNCKIESYDEDSSTKYKIVAKLSDKLYKAEKDLSKFAYIYIWPFVTGILDDKTVNYLIIKYNDKTYTYNSLSFTSINQYIPPIESGNGVNINSLKVSSNICGDLSDYYFDFDLDYSSMYLVQIFFPKEINFECEECVKCYDTTSGEKITCIFEDVNILNVFVSNSNKFIISGIINPKNADINSKLYFNFVTDDNNLSYKYSDCSISINLRTFISYIDIPKIEHLKFLFIKNSVSDNNPRNTATYTFRFSFDYANNEYTTSYPKLYEGSLLYIYFPRDYHLYINSNPTGVTIIYNYVDGTDLTYTVNGKILGRKILLVLTQDTKSNVKMKYIDIIINNIKNPTKGNNKNNMYTGYFKIVCLNSFSNQNTNQYYYITGINSNTYRTDLITDENIKTEEYNWYRGQLIKSDTNNAHKLILDVLYEKKTYNFIFLQPGRYTKVHFITSTDDENISNFYLKPSYATISFDSDPKIKTLEQEYIIPSLYGDLYEFYIGVECDIEDGIYILESTITSNSDNYLPAPTIIVNVRQIETAKIDFIQEDLGMSPEDGKLRIYYYLSDINVDSLYIDWTSNTLNSKVKIDTITIPANTITNITKKMSNVFSTATISREGTSTTNKFNFKISNFLNRCYEFNEKNLAIIIGGTLLNIDSNYKLINNLVISTSENDAQISSNDIKLTIYPDVLQPSFLLCELYCPYLLPDEENNLIFEDYKSMSIYLQNKNQNYFLKYTSIYIPEAVSSPSILFSNVIKGYNYNVECILQTTHSDTSDTSLTYHKKYSIISENMHSAYPPKTYCNTFYFLNKISKEVEQKYINYCQYVIGKKLGCQGCVICSDCSGNIISPGFSLYFPFNCQKEECYDKSSNELINDMYNLAEEFNINSKNTKYEFTICVTSNRICDTQIKEEDFNSAFNTFVNDVKDNTKANELFDIDYSDEKYIQYNGFYQNKIYQEDTIDINKLNLEFIEELSSNGNAVWKASYDAEISFNILCFWRIKLYEETTPTIEDMTNCKSSETNCGVFVANYGGYTYEIPEERRKSLNDGVYTMYITCSYFVPSPVYFSEIKDVFSTEIIRESFGGNFLNIKYFYLCLFIFLLL